MLMKVMRYVNMYIADKRTQKSTGQSALRKVDERNYNAERMAKK